MGQTVQLLLADCPPGRRRPSARLVGKRCSTGRSGSNNRPFARLADCPRGRRGLSARAARRWVPGRGPPWNFWFKHSPDHPSTSPDSPRGSPPCHPGIFFRISHSISQILSKKVIRVWRCDLNFVHGFKFLAWWMSLGYQCGVVAKIWWRNTGFWSSYEDGKNWTYCSQAPAGPDRADCLPPLRGRSAWPRQRHLCPVASSLGFHSH
jgi:hypothetical protein